MIGRRALKPIVGVTIIGAGVTAAVAAAATMSAREAMELGAIAAGTALGAVVIGALVLNGLRRRSIGMQAAALALTTIAAVMAGAFAAARAMFISEHDLGYLAVVLVAAGTVGVASALVLGARITAASSSLIATTQRIANPEHEPRDTVVGTRAGPRVAPSELERLGRELAEMEFRLDESRHRERSLEAARRELVAWVSHDLRTPLAGIRAMAEALEDGLVSDPKTVSRYYRTMREQTDHLAALVDDLFELSRTQMGTPALHMAPVSLGDLVSDALAGSQPIADAKGVQLVGRMVGPPPELVAAAPEVLRVLRNLLENAIRYTPSDGSVVVTAGVDDTDPNSVFVAVHDAGGGVPDADLERIFDVSYQGDPARTPGGGAGLGLAIARGFAVAHRGDITVANEGGGARFVLRLPMEHV